MTEKVTLEVAEGLGDGKSLADRVIDSIQQGVISGEFTSDRVFSEAEIASLCEVSKSPVREALSLLRRQGWIEVLPRAGFRVAALSLRDAMDLMLMRVALEPEAAALAADRAHRFADQVAALREFGEAPPTSASDADRVLAHQRFHRRVTLMSGNSELERTLTACSLKLRRYQILEERSGKALEHQWSHLELAELIEAGNARSAASAAREHADQARELLKEALINSDTLQYASLTPSGTRSQPAATSEHAPVADLRQDRYEAS